MSDSATTQAVAEQNFSSPERECDLVMKGGLTSGVIYPPAILELATKYRFRNIGGTSAGAIAAAATAAAEYGRAHGRGQEAFQTLGKISDDLGSCLVPPEADSQDQCEVSFILNLFQPTPETRPLFSLALALLQPSPASTSSKRSSIFFRLLKLKSLLRTYLPSSFEQGAKTGLVLAVVVALGLTSLSFWVLSLFGGEPSWAGFFILLLVYGLPLVAIARPVAGILAVLKQLWAILTQEVVSRNGFGLCTGTAGVALHQPGKALTDWLHEDVINKLADKPLHQPLTFGNLSHVEDRNKRITLNMVTCNLSHNRPYQLPFQDPVFIFHKDEFDRLFPLGVVTYLVENAPPATILARGQSCPIEFTDKKYHFLPVGDAMPVLVATRMSLSFPLLFSAIPLYTIAASSQAIQSVASPGSPIEIKPEDLQRNWFSDGGITNNFPIHFFDAWVPGRPTFGINLTTWKGQIDRQGQSTPSTIESAPQASQFSYMPSQPLESPLANENVHLPEADETPFPFWKNLDNDLLAFIMSIVDTSQSYRDTMQSMLPSYRERIVQIRLASNEGGLNLSMPPAVIQSLKQRGKDAGTKLLEKFYDGPQFQHHQWVRLKVIIGLLEQQLNAIAAVVNFYHLDYEALLAQQKEQSNEFPFSETDDVWIEDALGRLKELEELVVKWQRRQSQQAQPEMTPPAPDLPSLGFADQQPLKKENLELRVTPEL